MKIVIAIAGAVVALIATIIVYCCILIGSTQEHDDCDE